MSHEINLPIIKPFTIPSLGWTFTDNRDFDDAGSAIHQAAWLFHVQRLFAARDTEVGDFVCSHNQIHEITEKWIGKLESDPLLELEDYMAQDNREVHTDIDGSRPQYFLGISNATGEAIGGITVTNIDVLASSSEHIEVAGIMLLGVPYDGNLGTTWTVVYDYLINTPMPMVNGSSMNFIEYELTYLNSTDPELDEFTSMLSNTVDIIGTIDDTAPTPQSVICRRRQ